jgi:hypothetical protein
MLLTHLWLLLRVLAHALCKDGDVVLLRLGKLVVSHCHNLDAADYEARLLERLALHAGEEVLVLLEVPARKPPLS